MGIKFGNNKNGGINKGVTARKTEVNSAVKEPCPWCLANTGKKNFHLEKDCRNKATKAKKDAAAASAASTPTKAQANVAKREQNCAICGSSEHDAHSCPGLAEVQAAFTQLQAEKQQSEGAVAAARAVGV